MLVDTDVLIWNLRGEPSAANRLDRERGFAISAVTYMELTQGVRDKNELSVLRRALRFWSSDILHVDSAISARAMFLVEEHALSDSLQLADALIAATALEYGLPLLTGNVKHYRPIDGLVTETFRPS
jgi:predicted nucleic acid-binding protein